MTEHEPRPRLPAYQVFLRAHAEAFARYQADPSHRHLGDLAATAQLLELALLLLPGQIAVGQVGATPGARQALRAAGHIPPEFLLRHKMGDWGELDAHDRRVNAAQLARRGRLLSAYTMRTGASLWVITDAGWEATTLLLPEEY